MDGYYVKLLAVRMNKKINIFDKLLKCVLIKYPKRTNSWNTSLILNYAKLKVQIHFKMYTMWTFELLSMEGFLITFYILPGFVHLGVK